MAGVWYDERHNVLDSKVDGRHFMLVLRMNFNFKYRKFGCLPMVRMMG